MAMNEKVESVICESVTAGIRNKKKVGIQYNSTNKEATPA